MNKEKKKQIKVWQIGLLLATIAATMTKLYIGMDHDESYVVMMGIRLLNGDKPFDTMWDLHMTSAFLAWLFTEIFVRITGSIEGLVIFLRLISVGLQFIMSGIFYKVMKKYYSSEAVFMAAIAMANFLPRATQNLEYGLLEMIAMVLASVLLYDVLQKKKKEDRTVWWELGMSAFLYAVAVLSYPTVLISFPVLLVVLWLGQDKGKRRWQLPLFFAGVCALLGGLFLGYLFSYLSVQEFLTNLQGILSDGSHAQISAASAYGTQLLSLGKRIAVFLFLALLFYVIFHRWLPDKRMIFYYLLAVSALILIGFNVTGIRPSGPIGLQVRYLIVTVAAVWSGFEALKRDKLLAGLFMLNGVAGYIGVMYGSNMGLEENASFLYLCIFVAVMLAMENANKAQKVCVILFVCSIIFTKGCLVRITGTGPANILEHRVCVQEDAMKGIFIYPDDAEKIKEKTEEIQKYTSATDKMLYLGDEALCNTFTAGSFTSATCISTPVYNEEWVLYYENEMHPQPTVIFVDKDMMKTWTDFAETEFGEYLIERFSIEPEDVIEEKAFYIYKVTVQ